MNLTPEQLAETLAALAAFAPALMDALTREQPDA